MGAGSGAVSGAGADVAVRLEPVVRDLHLRLVAGPGEAEIVPGLRTPVLRYRAEVLDGDPGAVAPSGSYLGPTLHLRQGQRVRVDFVNELDAESIVHWHGLAVPEGQDGGPLLAVPPGGSYAYDFVVENRPGTYWYHPHPHHRTGEQVYRGLAGLLVVHGDEPAALSALPELALVLQDRTIGRDGTLRYATTQHDRMAGFVGDTLVTNGVAGLEVSVGRRAYRLRLLNGANSATRHLRRSDGVPLLVVATDGNLLPSAQRVPALVLTPAQRGDVWIDFSGVAPGTRIELLAADTFVESGGMGGGMGAGMGGGMGGGTGAGSTALVLDHRVAATFVVDGTEPVASSEPSALGGPAGPDPAEAADPSAVTSFVLSTRMGTHLINDRQWDGRNVTAGETVRAGTVVVWEFENRSPMAHPMHVHGSAFRIVQRTWADRAAEGSWSVIADAVLDDGLHDTVLVWPGQRVRIAVRVAEHRGHFPYHCHILEHEDGGMMRSFLVV